MTINGVEPTNKCEESPCHEWWFHRHFEFLIVIRGGFTHDLPIKNGGVSPIWVDPSDPCGYLGEALAGKS